MVDPISITSLALQLPDTIQKLKGFYDRVKDAPEDIRRTLEEIESLTLVLKDVNHSIDNREINVPAVEAAVKQSVAFCESCNSDLRLLVQDIDRDMPKKKIRSSFKAVWRRDKIMDFERRLQAAKLNLVLANERYYHAINRLHQQENVRYHRLQDERWDQLFLQINTLVLRTEEQARPLDQERRLPEQRQSLSQTDDSQVSEALSSSSKEEANSYWRYSRLQVSSMRSPLGSIEYKRVRRRLYIPGDPSGDEYSTEVTSYTLQPADWLSRWRFQVQFPRSTTGWNHNFRVSRIRPDDSPIFQFCREGNLEAIQKLFSAGVASPDDADASSHFTPLHYAALYGHPRVVRFLLQNNADVNATSCRGPLAISKYISHRDSWRFATFLATVGASTPLQCLLQSNDPYEDRQDNWMHASENKLRDILRLLIQVGGSNPVEEYSSGHRVLLGYRGPPASFSWLLSESSLEFDGLAEPNWGSLFAVGATSLSILFTALTHPTMAKVIHRADYGGRTVLHWLTKKWARSFLEDNPDLNKREELLRLILNSNVDLHATASTGRTPFIEIFDSMYSGDIPCVLPQHRRLRKCVVRWFELLVEIGIDLSFYIEQDRFFWNKSVLLNLYAPISHLKILSVPRSTMVDQFWIEIKWKFPENLWDWANSLKGLRGLWIEYESEFEYSREYESDSDDEDCTSDEDGSEYIFEDDTPMMPGGWVEDMENIS